MWQAGRLLSITLSDFEATFLASVTMALQKQKFFIAIKWERATRHRGEPHRLALPGAHFDMDVQAGGGVGDDKRVRDECGLVVEGELDRPA
jgi:hypothetical protein